MKCAGKARNNGLYRHIRTSKEIIRNLLNDSLKNITYVFKDVVQYPLSIFGTPLQIILTVFIPLGFTTFYPLQPLLGKQDMGIFPVFIQYLSPLVAIVMVLLLLLAWRTVINKYESTGT